MVHIGDAEADNVVEVMEVGAERGATEINKIKNVKVVCVSPTLGHGASKEVL